jgi:hypothetical protein
MIANTTTTKMADSSLEKKSLQILCILLGSQNDIKTPLQQKR